MSNNTITWITVDTAAMVLDQLHPEANASSLDSVDRISRYFDGIANGAFYFTSIQEDIGAVYATDTITISSTGPTNGQVMTVAGLDITAVSGTPSGDQVKTNASATVVATEVAALLNSSATWAGIVTATSALGVVTVKAALPGTMGNFVPVDAGNWSNTVVATPLLAGGTQGTVVTLR
jgi:phage tail sheath gpL-like